MCGATPSSIGPTRTMTSDTGKALWKIVVQLGLAKIASSARLTYRTRHHYPPLHINVIWNFWIHGGSVLVVPLRDALFEMFAKITKSLTGDIITGNNTFANYYIVVPKKVFKVS